MARTGRPKGTERTGGRKAGTPNKRTQELRERLQEAMGEGWCAVTAMARMTLEPDLKPEVKARLLAEVAAYQSPKPKPRVFDVDEEVELAELLEAARRGARGRNGMTLEELVSSVTIVTGVPERDTDPAPAPSEQRETPADSYRMPTSAPANLAEPERDERPRELRLREMRLDFAPAVPDSYDPYQ